MNKNLLGIILLMLNTLVFAQNWTQQSDLPALGRFGAIGESIGNKGYIGTGRTENGVVNDFWEWNQTTEKWTKKPDFPGTKRYGAISFTINDTIYVGSGYDGKYKSDMWGYDITNNVWSRKADIPIARGEAVGFSIGEKGYIMTGSTTGKRLNDFWEYDPVLDKWEEKSKVPAQGTFLASGFSIGKKGYLLLNTSDFWEWDQEKDLWTKKANINTTSVGRAIDFSMNGKGYIGSVGRLQNEFWEYDPIQNLWHQLEEDIPNGYRSVPVGFSIGNTLYAGTGYYISSDMSDRTNPYRKDFWSISNIKYKGITASSHNNKNIESEIKIYPNPAVDVINVSITDASFLNNYKLELRNTTSTLLWEKTINTSDYSIDVSSLEDKGLYFLSIFKDNGELIDVRKIILE